MNSFKLIMIFQQMCYIVIEEIALYSEIHSYMHGCMAALSRHGAKHIEYNSEQTRDTDMTRTKLPLCCIQFWLYYYMSL